MVGYKGIAIFDKSISRKVVEKDVAKRLYKYADYPESFASQYMLGDSVERYPKKGSNPNWKLDHFGVSEESSQVKDIPEKRLKDLWANGLIDKYGVFTERNDYCVWDSERDEDICDKFRVRDWDNFYDTFLKELDPEDWIAVFDYHL